MAWRGLASAAPAATTSAVVIAGMPSPRLIIPSPFAVAALIRTEARAEYR